MRYASVCSGIEAATVAWHPLGWEPAWFAEIDAFPSAVLAHRFPDVPNLGDFTKIENEHGSIDLIVGGTPCQDFSVAGKRAGFGGLRGSLTLAYVDLVRRVSPRWVVWENVPGVLGGDTRRGFAQFMRALSDCGYSCCWRVLDAQYVRVDGMGRAVSQRRRRVFLVGHSDWRRAAAVLLEPESLRGDSPPRREPGKGVAPSLAVRTKGGGGLGTDFDCDGGLIGCPVVSPALKARDHKGASSDGDGDGAPLIAHSLRADGFDASEDGTGRGTPIVPELCFDATQITSPQNHSVNLQGATCHSIAAGAHPPAIAFDCKATDCQPGGTSPTMRGMTHDKSHANGGGQLAVAFISTFSNQSPETELSPTLGIRPMATTSAMRVRRITPVETERLQGFPDGWTQVPYRGKPASDGPRYKALGNSMAVNVMRWIGRRIEAVDAPTQQEPANA